MSALKEPTIEVRQAAFPAGAISGESRNAKHALLPRPVAGHAKADMAAYRLSMTSLLLCCPFMPVAGW